MKKFISLLLCLSIASCASYNRREVPPPLDAVRQQVKVLSTWSEGMEIQKIAKEIEWHVFWRAELIEAGRDLKFIYAENPATRGNFGMYFEDRTLVSLLTKDDADFLRDCLTPFNHDGKHWAKNGLLQYLPWVSRHSILGNRKALSASGVFREYEDNSEIGQVRRKIDDAAATVLTAVVYAPFFLVSIPFMFEAGALAEEKMAYVERVHAFLNSIELGQVTPSIREYQPDATFLINDMDVYQYDIGSFAFGTQGGKVIMIESPAVLELYERQMNYGGKFYSRNTCQDLIMNPRHNVAK